MKRARGPIINKNDVMTIVPVKSNQFAMPEVPSKYHGSVLPPKKYSSSPPEAFFARSTPMPIKAAA